MQTIVSVHTPKVAGTSFLRQLKDIYGENQVLQDYSDDPANPLSVICIDPNSYDVSPIKSISPFKIVHGHFHPRKYAHLVNAYRLTFLRHPVDNIMSIYNFWSARELNFWSHPVFNYFKKANLSLSRLAMLAQLRYLYSRTYFGGFDMANFDFIGDYACYEQELMRLGESLGVRFDRDVRHNVTAHQMGPAGSGCSHRALSDDEFAELARILKDDIDFYEAYKGR